MVDRMVEFKFLHLLQNRYYYPFTSRFLVEQLVGDALDLKPDGFIPSQLLLIMKVS